MMKQKILYITFAVFVIVIFISLLINIWFNREYLKIKLNERETMLQETMIKTQGIFVEQLPPQSAPASLPKPAITIIKPLVKEKTAPDLEEKIEEIHKPQGPLSWPTHSPPITQSANDDFADEPASGITKISKPPSETESKEMDEQGIIIW